jgi:hypothetical protein
MSHARRYAIAAWSTAGLASADAARTGQRTRDVTFRPPAVSCSGGPKKGLVGIREVEI